MIFSYLNSKCENGSTVCCVWMQKLASGNDAGKGGGQGGRLPPNVEKDGPRNSSKFDEKIGGGGWVSISDVKKS